MLIPLNVDVHCIDGLGGRVIKIILNPVTSVITHLVVAGRRAPSIEYLVPFKVVKRTTPGSVLLGCTRADLTKMEYLFRTRYFGADASDTDELLDEALRWPNQVYSRRGVIAVRTAGISRQDLEIRHGAQVKASNGKVGVIGGFLVEPSNGCVTHILLRKGHLWGNKQVTVSISEIERFEDAIVYLKLAKKAVAELPVVPAELS